MKVNTSWYNISESRFATNPNSHHKHNGECETFLKKATRPRFVSTESYGLDSQQIQHSQHTAITQRDII
eukprot:11179007-Heterocapsa_arctica.AAC.1